MSRELLARPAEEGVRRLALVLLDRAHEASLRLVDPADVEALHDFRVAIRRLRSTLRAYRPHFAGSLSKKRLESLRGLAEATNPGRDAEVQLLWLAQVRIELRRHERPGCDWLVTRLVERKEAAYRKLQEEVRHDFTRLEERLREGLSRYRIEVELDAGWQPVPFGRVLAEALTEHGSALAAALAEVHALADERQAHAARIEAKRLRYLLDPFAEEIGARDLARQLRSLQDLLGDLNDAHLLAAEVGKATATAAAERAGRLHALALAGSQEAPALRRALRTSERAGLLAITRRLAERREELFGDLAERWLEGRGAPFFAAVAELAGELDSVSPAPAG